MTAVVPQAVERTRPLLEAAMHEAIDGLHPSIRLVAAYHLGWCDEQGRPISAGGGKALRPTLCLLSAEAAGAPAEVGLPGAVAVELVHNFSLLHDDVMDGDVQRRHRPSAWSLFGEGTAILAGDALHCHAFTVLAEEDTHRDPAVRAELVRGLSRAAGPRGMCGGQMLDMLAETADEPLSESQVGRLQTLKTGKLIEFAAEAGAVLGKAPSQLRHALCMYGRELGAAFQIADDLLDATASPDEAGKRTGKDAEAGKATLVGLMGPERARLQAERLVAQAKAHLDGFDEQVDLLRMLADFTIQRRS